MVNLRRYAYASKNNIFRLRRFFFKGELSEFPLTPPRGLELLLSFLCTNDEKKANIRHKIARRPAGLAAVGCYLSPLGRLNYRQCAAVSRAARSAAVCARPHGGQGGEGVVPRP
jgi:hypothetical protein